VPRDDPVLLVVPRRVPRELKDLKRREETRRIKDSASSAGQVGGMGGVTNLGGEVLEDGGKVDGGAAADALGVAAVLEEYLEWRRSLDSIMLMELHYCIWLSSMIQLFDERMKSMLKERPAS
jgi:hypothetical protein